MAPVEVAELVDVGLLFERDAGWTDDADSVSEEFAPE